MYGDWWKTGMNMTMLALEAQGVIVQRMMMFSMGDPQGQAEAQRMVNEKVYAASEAAMKLAFGASNDEVIRDYRRKVQANSRRLDRH